MPKNSNTNAKKICHLSSAHKRFDVRIYHKECKALVEAGHDVHFIVADGLEDLISEGISIHDVGQLPGRFNRMLKTTRNVFNKAKELNADIYHFHDPELLFVGVRLQKLGKRVIYDAHEDLPRAIFTKSWISSGIRRIVSNLSERVENWGVRKLTAVVGATPFITERFNALNIPCININNFPQLTEFKSTINWADKGNEICYMGGITQIRGIRELIQSLEFTDTVLNLAGNAEANFLSEIEKLPSWQKVNYLGLIERSEVQLILEKSRVGIVTFLAAPNHINAQPNKIFEYMSAGIPLVASNFPLWKEIIEKHNCGICVDPANPREISDAIKYLLENPEEAKAMGQNGLKIVSSVCNWEIEKSKLQEFYGIL